MPMASKTIDMTSGNPAKIIFVFSLPTMLGNIFQQGYAFADSIILGRGAGASALAMVGATDWINWLFLWAIFGFAQGFSTLVAESFGANDPKRLRKFTAMIILLDVFFSLLFVIVGELIALPLLQFLHTDSTILGGSLLYLRIQIAAIPIILTYNISASILRCVGNSRDPFIAVAIASVINIGLDLLFVLVFHMGVLGAAIATVIAQVFSLLYCLLTLRSIPLFHLQKSDWRPNRRMLQLLCFRGVTTAAQGSIIAAGGLAVQSTLNQLGLAYVTGFTTTNKIIVILESAANALDYAVIAYMGQNYGARQAERISRGMRASILISVAFSGVLMLLMLVFGRHILGLFISRSEPMFYDIMNAAFRFLRVVSIGLIFLFLSHIYRAALTGLGKVTAALLSGFVETAMRLLVVFILPFWFGKESIFLSETAAWFGVTIQLAISYYYYLPKIRRSFASHNSTPI